MKIDRFQSCGHCWVFQICWHIECSTWTESSFRTLNSSAGIQSPLPALFIAMLPKAHLTLHSTCLALHLAQGCLLLLPSSFTASGTFPVSQLFVLVDQNTGVSASASVLPTSSGLISLKIVWSGLLANQGILRSLFSTAFQRHQFFGAPPSLCSFSHNHTWLLGRP